MKKIIGLFLTYSQFLLLATILVISSSVAQDWVQNIMNMVMVQVPFVLIYSFGMTIAVLTGGLDLSLGSVAAFSTCAAAFLLIRGQIVAGVVTCLLIGAILGMLNGLLITKAKVNPFIATYGMDWVIRGAVYIMMHGAMIYHFSSSFRNIADGSVFGVSNLVIIAVVVLVILLFVFQKTVFGRNVYMAGANISVTHLTGVNTDLIIIIVYMISGALASTAGLLYVARLDCAEAFLGKDFSLQALAATLIGGTSLQGGKGGLSNTVVGVFIIVFLMNCLNILKVSSLWQGVVFGAVIVISALLQRARQNYLDRL
jgi:ribose transport system permease protein